MREMRRWPALVISMQRYLDLRRFRSGCLERPVSATRRPVLIWTIRLLPACDSFTRLTSSSSAPIAGLDEKAAIRTSSSRNAKTASR
jgi:hypothetical protein